MVLATDKKLTDQLRVGFVGAVLICITTKRNKRSSSCQAKRMEHKQNISGNERFFLSESFITEENAYNESEQFCGFLQRLKDAQLLWLHEEIVCEGLLDPIAFCISLSLYTPATCCKFSVFFFSKNSPGLAVVVLVVVASCTPPA